MKLFTTVLLVLISLIITALSVKSYADSDVTALMALSEEEMLRCVPKRNPLVFAANPITLQYPRNYREWHWDPREPDRVIDPDSGMKFPNPDYPEDNSFTVLNTLGETVSIPYYQGRTPELLLQRKQHPDRYLFSYAAANMQYNWMMKAIDKLGKAYDETGEELYARRLALLLYDFGKKLKHYPIVANNAQHGGKWPISTGGPWMLNGKPSGTHREDLPYPGWLDTYLTRKGFWGEVGPALTFAEAFVAIKDSPVLAELSREKGVDIAAEIEKEPIRFLIDHVIRYPWKGAHLQNNLTSYVTKIGEVGKLIGEPEYVHFVYNWAAKSPFYYDTTHDGLTGGGTAYTAGASFLEKALYLRGYSDPPGYISKMDGLHLQDVDIAQQLPFLAKMSLAPEMLRLPSGRVMPAHDATTWETQPGWRSGGGVYLYPTPRPASRNILMAGFGHALLGDGEGKRQSQAHLHFSRAAEHAHPDCMSLLLYAHGREMISDLGYFHHPLRWWSGGSFSHNLVIIDEEGQNREMSKGNLQLFVSKLPGLAVACSEGKRAYRGLATKYRRTLIHNTRDLDAPYVIDIFEVEGGSQHDYLLHGSASARQKQKGTASLSMTNLAEEHPLSNGREDIKRDEHGYSEDDPYYMWANVGAAKAGHDFFVDFRYNDNPNLGSRHFFPRDARATLYLGETLSMRSSKEQNPMWQTTYEDRMPHMILRRRGDNLKSVFVAVHQLFDGAPSISAVHYIDLGPESVVLEIDLGTQKDTLFYSLSGPKRMVHNGTSTDGLLGFISSRDGKDDAYLVGGTALKKDRRTLLTLPQPEYRGTLLDVKRKYGGDSTNAFITKADIPLGDELHGVCLNLTFDGHWKIGDLGAKGHEGEEGNEPITTGYQIDYVERKGYETWIHLLDDEPGLVVEKGKTTELFLGRRTYDAPGTFVVYAQGSTVPDNVVITPGLPPQEQLSEVPFVPFNDLIQVTAVSSPGAEIHYTTDNSRPTTASPRYIKPLTVRRTTTVKAIAVRPGMLFAPRVAAVTYKAALPSVAVNNIKPGLRCYLYEEVPGDVKNLPRQDYLEHCLSIGTENDLPVLASGLTPDLGLVGDLSQPKFRTGYAGYLKVPADGVYTFHLFVNPGCTLAIDGIVLHNKRRVGVRQIWRESIALQQGLHELKLLYSDNTIKSGKPFVKIQWESPGLLKKQPISKDSLFHAENQAGTPSRNLMSGHGGPTRIFRSGNKTDSRRNDNYQ